MKKYTLVYGDTGKTKTFDTLKKALLNKTSIDELSKVARGTTYYYNKGKWLDSDNNDLSVDLELDKILREMK